MVFSTRGRYGLRAMYELYRLSSKGTVPLKTLAENQGLSKRYLEQLFGPLRRNGLVRSTRGAKGGYRLARPAEQITVGDIVRALEGPIAPTDCLLDTFDGRLCGKPEGCVAKDVSKMVKNAIDEVLDRITLAQLSEDC